MKYVDEIRMAIVGKLEDKYMRLKFSFKNLQ